MCRSCLTHVKISVFYESSTYVQECGYGLLHVPYMRADVCPGYGSVATLFVYVKDSRYAAYEDSQC